MNAISAAAVGGEPTIARLYGLDIAFHDEGTPTDPPVLLVHGFASNARVNWFLTSWVSTLTGSGRRVIAFDNRGHGESTKFYEPQDYGPDIFARDAVALLDHLEIERADVVGFSMGARIAFGLAHWHPTRVGKVCLCGMGANLFGGARDNEPIARALEAPSAEAVTDPAARTFRAFASRTGSDLRALAACIRPSEVRLTPDMAGSIAAPILIAVGGDDEVSGAAEPLAALIPGGEAFTVPGRDHMKSTGDKAIKAAVMDFLHR